jgi:hypothetical protein
MTYKSYSVLDPYALRPGLEMKNAKMSLPVMNADGFMSLPVMNAPTMPTNESQSTPNLVPNQKFNQASGPNVFNQHLTAAAAKAQLPASWLGALTELVRRESGFNPTAKNPKSTAYGYGQFLASTRANYEKKMGLNYNNPVDQLVMMSQYVKDRYKTPQQAIAFWDKNHWY